MLGGMNARPVRSRGCRSRRSRSRLALLARRSSQAGPAGNRAAEGRVTQPAIRAARSGGPFARKCSDSRQPTQQQPGGCGEGNNVVASDLNRVSQDIGTAKAQVCNVSGWV